MRGVKSEAERIKARRREVARLYFGLKVRSLDEIAHALHVSSTTIDTDLVAIRKEMLTDTRTRIVAENYLTESLAEKDAVIREAWRIYDTPTKTVKGKIKADDSFRKFAALQTIIAASKAKDRLLGFTAPKQVERLTTILKQGGDIAILHIEQSPSSFMDRLNRKAEALLQNPEDAKAQGAEF